MTGPIQYAAKESTIVTLTMNPALDITKDTDFVVPTDKMRCSAVLYDPGGGGINVARIARVLGASVAAVFPAGGATGDLVTELLAPEVPPRRVRRASRRGKAPTVNETSSGRQYRFVLPGPWVTFAEQAECLNAIAGGGGLRGFRGRERSLPPNVHPDHYQRVADICQGARCGPDSRHLRRRASAHHRRGVPAEAQRARASGMRRTGA